MSAAHALPAVKPAERRRLGRGRSGEVWLVEGPQGRLATKVFHGDTLSNLVHYLLTGAPNPYIWSEDAIRAAFERRKILAALIPIWFGERLQVADAVAVSAPRAPGSSRPLSCPAARCPCSTPFACATSAWRSSSTR